MGIKKTLLNSWAKPNVLTKVLRPFSSLYRGAFALRRTAFKFGMFDAYQAPVPVVVVGNITVGGTGKTPLVLHIVQALLDQGYRPGVISRGYGGITDEYPLWVDKNTDVKQSGDEPALIVRRTNVPFVVGPNRRDSIELLLAQQEIDLIISDDGLQHFALERDVEVCLIDETSIQKNQNLLPAGPYRESMSRLLSVDLIVRHGGQIGNADNQFSMELNPSAPLPVNSNNQTVFPSTSEIHAVAGIGNPDRFFNTCRAMGYQISEHRFPDHHRFSADDIDFNGEAVLMTEKDAVKCDQIADDRHWYLPVDAVLSKGFISALIDKLTTNFNARLQNG